MGFTLSLRMSEVLKKLASLLAEPLSAVTRPGCYGNFRHSYVDLQKILESVDTTGAHGVLCFSKLGQWPHV